MNKKTEAGCKGAMLTVGFHGANPPLIWRFDLERNHSFTLALQGEEGDWELGVTSPKGDFYPVVHFIAREDAEEAFAKVEKILAHRSTGFGAIGKALFYVVIGAVLVFGAVVAYGYYMQHAPAVHAGMAGIAPAPSAVIQPGVPMSADEVLKPPAQ